MVTFIGVGCLLLWLKGIADVPLRAEDLNKLYAEVPSANASVYSIEESQSPKPPI